VTPDRFAQLKVLLVEDNPINQKVATEILRLGGIEPKGAENGLEAVAAVESGHFDLVLMDIQMPEMDGLEATRVIRRELGLSDLPIIAMTAHATEGDRDKCLTAGMDDYVSKPIDPELLFQAIGNAVDGGGDHHVPISREPAERHAADAAQKDFPGLNYAEGLARVGGSRELYQDILDEYCDFYQDVIPEFAALIDREDFTAARKKAHALKGAAGNLSAMDLKLAAEKLETACRENDAGQARSLLAVAEKALLQLFDNASNLKALNG